MPWCGKGDDRLAPVPMFTFQQNTTPARNCGTAQRGQFRWAIPVDVSSAERRAQNLALFSQVSWFVFLRPKPQLGFSGTHRALHEVRGDQVEMASPSFLQAPSLAQPCPPNMVRKPIFAQLLLLEGRSRTSMFGGGAGILFREQGDTTGNPPSLRGPPLNG